LNTLNMKLSVWIALFLFCVGSYSSEAETLRAVVLQSEGDRVVINRGTEDGVKVGQTWVLGLDDKTGAVVIEEAGEHSASGRLRGEASVGTLAALGSEADIADLRADERAKQQMVTSTTNDSETLKQLRNKYKRALSARTESRGFVTPIGNNGPNMQAAQLMNLGVEAYNVSRMYDLTRDIGLDPTGVYSPWWLAASAVQMVGGSMQRNQMYESQRVRVDAEVVYWDQDLVDIQTEVSCAEKGLSLSETLSQKVVMQQKRGSDKYTVFEVSLKNVGKLPAQIGNFKYKMFLLSHEGQPISASRVDPVLDQTVQPGGEIRGMVYFPKIVSLGQSELKVTFEQMFGDRGELTFKAR
jgi:hypothetical protein